MSMWRKDSKNSRNQYVKCKNAILTVCPCGCPKILAEVCGTDGKTYGNKCVMECESCEQGTNVTVANHGKCPEELGGG